MADVDAEESKSNMSRSYQRKVVLIGMHGSGVSSVGNTLLERDSFEVGNGLLAVTQRCQIECSSTHLLVDTPGLFNIEDDIQEQVSELLNVYNLCPNPHVFILIFDASKKLTYSNLRCIELFQHLFGKHFVKYAIVVFTHARFHTANELETFWNRSKEMSKLIHKCGYRVCGIDNKAKFSDKSKAVTTIISLVDDISQNGAKIYSFAHIQHDRAELMRILESEYTELNHVYEKLSAVLMALEKKSISIKYIVLGGDVVLFIVLCISGGVVVVVHTSVLSSLTWSTLWPMLEKAGYVVGTAVVATAGKRMLETLDEFFSKTVKI